MPSEDRVNAALGAVAPATERYRAALTGAIEQARSRLAGRSADARARAARLCLELGRFADGRIRADRLAALVAAEPDAAPDALDRMQAALETMEALHVLGDALFRVHVPPGGVLAAKVHEALAEVGRAFGAARVFEAAQAGRFEADVGDPLGSFAYRRWSAAERRIAPPLVVRVSGESLRPVALAGVLDEGVKIVLVVEGACAPAPLARLISPGTLVIQAVHVDALAPLAETSAPAIAALVPDSAARFVHDPAAGTRFWQRLRIERMPDEPTRSLGGLTAAQQAEELRHLRELAEPPAGAGAATGAHGNGASAGVDAAASVEAGAGQQPNGTPEDRLAMWLLQRADLDGLG